MICLIGLPGSGKTTLGRALSEKLDCPFYDLDAVIEERAGKSIGEIFGEMGEPGFRKLESEALKAVWSEPPGVLSTGGGTPLLEENADILKTGVIIFVDRLREHIERDIKRAHRPLLKNASALKVLEKERRPVYEAISHRTLLNAGSFDEGILKLLEIVKALEKGVSEP